MPRWYPHPLLLPFRRSPLLGRMTANVLRVLGQERASDAVGRLSRFRDAGHKRSQKAVLKRVMRFYPTTARFVVLPMDMAHIGFGPVRKDLRSQHDELAALAADYPDQLVPFATVYPGVPDSVAEARRAIETLGFRGLKIYPRLGYPPDHPDLMAHIYPLLEERGLPVMSHCSRGGVKGRQVSKHKGDRYTDPRAMVPVLEAFPNMQVCLAHFGGQEDFHQYADEGVELGQRDQNWVTSILDLISEGAYPNLWTDISYTVFRFDAYIPFLKVFLGDPLLRERVLFGSDYYMTAQEKLSERSVSFRLRDALGEDWFRQIAETNPARWLGDPPVPPEGQPDGAKALP